MEAVQDTKEVAKAIERQDFELAMSLRDAEFSEQYNSFMMTTAVQLDKEIMLPEKEVCAYTPNQRSVMVANVVVS
jgi:6-phosphofructokinase 1